MREIDDRLNWSSVDCQRMPRSIIEDYQQKHRFHLFDIPRPGMPPFALSPLAGFKAASLPTISIETEDHKPVNSYASKKFMKSVSWGTITLSRAVHWRDREFYHWAIRSVTGQGEIRRTLILIEFANLGPKAVKAAMNGSFLDLVSMPEAFVAGVLATGHNLPGFDMSSWFPARMWMLYRCIATRFDPGGGLDADSGDIMVQELEIAPETCEIFELM